MAKYRLFISYVSILILILNIGIANGVTNAVTINDDKILLCTSQGYAWVTISEIRLKFAQRDLQFIEKNSKEGSKEGSKKSNENTLKIHKCPFCTHNKVDSDDFIQALYGSKQDEYVYNAQLRSNLSSRVTDIPRHTSNKPRAPPFYA